MSVPLYVCFRQNFCSGNGACIYRPESEYKVACDCHDGWLGFDCRKEYPTFFKLPPPDSMKYLYLAMIITVAVLFGMFIGTWLAQKKLSSQKKNLLVTRPRLASLLAKP